MRRKNFKIIIIGFGSIGQRHYKNLCDLGYKDIAVFDVDQQRIKNPRTSPATGTVRGRQELRIKNINPQILEGFDVVFVCSPNRKHIRHAFAAAQAGCDIFIEKPLSHSLQGIDRLEKLCWKKMLVTMVACNMRFHPCVAFIKKYLGSKKLGKVYSISHECGYYLPYWRPKQDYTKNYAARKAEGGGIILDDIHEFDLLFWLNNNEKIIDSHFLYGKISDLKIETEDICIASFQFQNNVFGSIRCDYLQKRYSRNLKVVGEKGSLYWDYNENTVILNNEVGQKLLFEEKNYDINNFYVDEIKYFMECVEAKKHTFNDIKSAKEVLKVCLSKPR